MRIAVLGTPRSGTDPRMVRLVTSLSSAGHDVAFLSTGAVDERIEVATRWTIKTDTRWPRPGGRLKGLLRRVNPARVRLRNADLRIASVLTDLHPALVYAQTRHLADIADALGFTVVSDPRSGIHGAGDLTTSASNETWPADLATAVDWIPWVQRPFTDPAPGRHQGKRVAMCYHPTETTPARYLHAALVRAGVVVDHRYPHIDLDDVPDGTDGVLFVESPYPALAVTGTTNAPVLFWVHHGEHHIYPNLRLADRYASDGILLAHSFHLGHRFAVPVFPFPFGVPTEMLSGSELALEDRPLEMSMIASGFEEEGARYATRRELAAQMTSRFGSERVLFTGGLSPEEMFSVYSRSKIVLDEGGSLHRPITMRVFEATGSGAALATDPAPGIDMLFEAGTEFISLSPTRSIGDLPPAERLARIAQAGNRRALGVHTYDHRVDEMISIFNTVRKRSSAEIRSTPAIRNAVEAHAEIDSIACPESMVDEFAGTSYIVWNHREAADRGAPVDTVIVGSDEVPTGELLALAHRYVFCSPSSSSTVRTMLSAAGRSFIESSWDQFTVFDFETPGYIVRDGR